MRRALLIGLAATTLALMPSAALAAGHGGTPGTLSRGEGWLPTTASDGHGNVVAAWYTPTASGMVVSARLSADGGAHWRPAQTLGAANLAQADERPNVIQAAVDVSGDAIVVWGRLISGRMTVIAATAPRGRAFQPAAAISGAGASSFHPAVTASGQRFTIAWTGVTTVQDAVVTPAGTVISRATVATGQANPDAVAVAAGGAGRSAVAWVVAPSSTDSVIVARRATGSGTWSLATLSTNAVGGQPGLAISGTGRTTVTWSELQNLATDSEVIEARSAAWGKSFSAPQQLSASGWLAIPGGYASGSNVTGIDGAGHVSVVWVEVVPFGFKGGGRVAVATSDAAGKFGKARTLQVVSDRLTYERPEIAVASGGGIVATWTVYQPLSSGPSGRVWAARGTSTAAFGRPARVSGVSGDGSAVTTADRAGTAVIVWEQSDPATGKSSVRFLRWA